MDIYRYVWMSCMYVIIDTRIYVHMQIFLCVCMYVCMNCHACMHDERVCAFCVFVDTSLHATTCIFFEKWDVQNPCCVASWDVAFQVLCNCASSHHDMMSPQFWNSTSPLLPQVDVVIFGSTNSTHELDWKIHIHELIYTNGDDIQQWKQIRTVIHMLHINNRKIKIHK